jgi:hypothetical protein
MLGEWYQKTNKTEDTNKLTLLVFKIIINLHNTRLAKFIKLLETVSKGLFRNRSQNCCHTLLDSPNVLDTPHICNISRLRVKLHILKEGHLTVFIAVDMAQFCPISLALAYIPLCCIRISTLRSDHQQKQTAETSMENHAQANHTGRHIPTGKPERDNSSPYEGIPRKRRNELHFPPIQCE